METIELISQDVTKKLKVVTNGAVIIITARPTGLKVKSVTHIEVGTGSYAEREDWCIAEVIEQPQIATVTVERKKLGRTSPKPSSLADQCIRHKKSME